MYHTYHVLVRMGIVTIICRLSIVCACDFIRDYLIFPDPLFSATYITYSWLLTFSGVLNASQADDFYCDALLASFNFYVQAQIATAIHMHIRSKSFIGINFTGWLCLTKINNHIAHIHLLSHKLLYNHIT